MTKIEFEADGRTSKWWGRGDFYCDPTNAGPRILLPYAGEPAHGDSYHELIIDSKSIRGYVWSGYFLWSKCGRFFTCDWLEGMGGQREGASWVFTQVLRATIVVEPRALRYRVVLEPTRDEVHRILREDREDALWAVLLSPRYGDWDAFDSVSGSASSEKLRLSSNRATEKVVATGPASSGPVSEGGQQLLKTAVVLVLKRHWGLVAVILTIDAVSQWRHAHHISASRLLVFLLVPLLALFLTAVPVEFYKRRRKR